MKPKPQERVLPKPDADYSCKLIPPKEKQLASQTVSMQGRFVWAYVPTEEGVKKQIVFLKDDELPVEIAIIENFSEPPA